MFRREMILGLAAMGMTACTTGNPSASGNAPPTAAYFINPADSAAIQFRMLDSVNALRQTSGITPVELDGRLNAAAATHSRDMSRQNRPWLFGSDGSSPLDRARRVGFDGRLLGENISESYETELETLTAWMLQEDTRAVLLDPKARYMGIAWFQEPTGKIWWTLNMGSDPAVSRPIASLR